VLCPPIGFEGTCAFETFTALAEALCAAGFDVLRFDYHGTGDSPGCDADAARVDAWRGSVRAAARELRRIAGPRALALVGMRLGASFALLESDAAEVDAHSLVLWAPCASGRSFTRELKLAAAAHGAARDEACVGGLEALGFLYTDETLAALARIDLLRARPMRVRSVLLIGRSESAAEGPLGAALRVTSDVRYLARGGLEDIMRDSHERRVPEEIVQEIVDYLVERHPHAALEQEQVEEERTAAAHFEGVRESPVHFGPELNLFGILCEPETHSEHSRTAIVMLNVGTNHRVGPNRLYVRMARTWARAGYTTLRFDLAGIGDSRVAAGYATTRLYSRASTLDVQAAIDALFERGAERIVLVGLCSGAYVAFQSALTDRRVVAQVLLNPRRLSFSAGDTLESVMAESYKSSRYYGRALFSARTYLRLARGQVDIRGITGRMAGLVLAYGRRVSARVLGRPPTEEDVLSNVRLLGRRGVSSLFIVGEEDDGRDYVEFHLGARGKSVRSSRFRMLLVPGSDHTFSRVESQERVTRAVTEYLRQKLG
jgi:alpha-beta hydrolase superfamily lysophospholipase